MHIFSEEQLINDLQDENVKQITICYAGKLFPD